MSQYRPIPTTLQEALEAIERLRRLNEQLAARLAACSECLGRAAERKGFTAAEAMELVTKIKEER